MENERCSGVTTARLLPLLLLLLSTDSRTSAANVICPTATTFDTSIITDTFDPVERFSELSGLALSKQQVGPSGDPIFFGVNDKGGEARLGVWDSGTGQRLLTLNVPEPNIGM